jgi:hypothetical protein
MYKLRDVNRSIQFNPIDEVLEELHIYTGELGIKKKKKRFWGCKYQPLGEFYSPYVYKLHKRFKAK